MLLLGRSCFEGMIHLGLRKMEMTVGHISDVVNAATLDALRDRIKQTAKVTHYLGRVPAIMKKMEYFRELSFFLFRNESQIKVDTDNMIK